jgi:hypothetical protein
MGLLFGLIRALRWRRRLARIGRRDQTTKALLRSGVYRVGYPPHDDPELALIKSPSVPYSFWSSVKYIMVLSLLLWWIPTFGQMIAGYVGGRKAGNHWKAVLASLIPVMVILVLSHLGEKVHGSVTLTFLYSLPGRALEGTAAAVPEIAPYVLFALAYLRAFATALQSTLSMGTNGYLITIISAYIGGLMAEQNLRELDYEKGAVPRASTVVNYWAPPHRGWWHGGLRDYLPHPREENPWHLPERGEPRGWVHLEEPPAVHVERVPAHAFEPPRPRAQERTRRARLDREALVQRLVERALREYEAGN